MFPCLRRIVGGVVFYSVRVISKESRLLVLRRTYFSQFKVENSDSLHFGVVYGSHSEQGFNLDSINFLLVAMETELISCEIGTEFIHTVNPR
jgi:hypothetical protein